MGIVFAGDVVLSCVIQLMTSSGREACTWKDGAAGGCSTLLRMLICYCYMFEREDLHAKQQESLLFVGFFFQVKNCVGGFLAVEDAVFMCMLLA